MSIQRYRSDGQGDCDPGGMYVLYADHVAAVAEAAKRSGRQAFDLGDKAGRVWGRAAALQQAREAVAALAWSCDARHLDLPVEGRDDALAAIDALRGAECSTAP